MGRPGPPRKQVRVTRHNPSGTSTETLHVGTIGGTVPGSGGGPRTFRMVTWEDSTLVVDVETLRGQTGRAPSEQHRSFANAAKNHAGLSTGQRGIQSLMR